MIIKGCLLCKYVDTDGKMQQFYAAEGDVVRVHQSIHTFENDTDDEVQFVVFRYVPTGEDKRELIKSDTAPNAFLTKYRVCFCKERGSPALYFLRLRSIIGAVKMTGACCFPSEQLSPLIADVRSR